MNPFIHHASAIIDPGAIIGEGTRIWHFCHIMSGAVIGANCVLGQNVFIDNNVSIGNGVKIQNNVSVYNGVIVENDVFLGPSVVFTNIINPRSFINRKNEFRQTLIRCGATIGANSTIVCGVEVGTYSFVGAGSVVSRNVASFSLVYGNPARHRGWRSRRGHALQFVEGKATCPESGEHYFLVNNTVQLV